MIHTHLVKSNNDSDEHISKAAKTMDEARQLIEAGFEYICDIEGATLFRKRK